MSPRVPVLACLVAASCQTGTGSVESARRGAASHAAPAAHAPGPPPSAAADEGPVEWLKGSTHVHTVVSGDSTMPVDAAVRWYAEHQYDFIFITDHNRVTEVDGRGRPLVLRGVELTHNPGSCDPPPPEAEGRCRIHLNGLGVAAPPVIGAAEGAAQLQPGARPPVIEWKAQATSARLEMYGAGIDKIRQMGGIAQINHPSWHWGVSGDLLAALGRRGALLVEIANMGFARWNLGTADRPSSEALWDAALSQGVLLYGVASDDAHHYRDDEVASRAASGRPVYQAGTGWIMVRARRRPDAIREAIERGEFYSSTGVVLDRAGLEGGALAVDVAPPVAGAHEITFIGQGGAVLARSAGPSARFDLAHAPAGYLRAVVARDDGARAWVQPVWVPPADGQPRAGLGGTRRRSNGAADGAPSVSAPASPVSGSPRAGRTTSGAAGTSR